VELVSKIYSAVMDAGTCDECNKWDGAEFPIDFPEDFTGVQGHPRVRCRSIGAPVRSPRPLRISTKRCARVSSGRSPSFAPQGPTADERTITVLVGLIESMKELASRPIEITVDRGGDPTVVVRDAEGHETRYSVERG
jgi:hypothetical protein